MTGDGRQVMAKAHIAFVIQHMPRFKKNGYNSVRKNVGIGQIG
jgi:hypothetical protein